VEKELLMATKVKNILISQPPPIDDSNPFVLMSKKWNVKVEFRKFIQIEGISAHDFRKQNLDPLKFTAVILTSKYAIDHFFRILKDLKIELPPDMKYFCVSDATAKYLQKYIVIRKRKLYVGTKSAEDLIDSLKKNASEKFLYPCSDVHRTELTDYMHNNGYFIKEAIIYQTVASDLKDVVIENYDMLCFFSPSGIESLFKNFPQFVQNEIRIGVFGPTTAKAAKDAGLIVEIEAPSPNAPSMATAIENYLKTSNK
jgi:uroporphyrinogen-III synthase